MTTTDIGIAHRSSDSLEGFRPFLIVGASAAIAAASIATALLANGLNEHGWRVAVQYSGRVAVLLFLVPFLAGPLARLFRSRGLLIDRRAYGLGFAVAFAAYLGTVVAPFILAHQTVPPTVLAFAAVLGALLVVQVLTANPIAMRVFGFRTWSRIHTFAMYGYWTAFTIGFLDHVVSPSRPDFFMSVGLCLMVAALLVRFTASFAAKVGLAEKVA